MLDLRGRSRLAPFLDPVAGGLSKARLTPTIVTVVGLVVTMVGAGFIAVEWYILGAGIAGAGALLDALDGPLARLQGTASIRGAFIDTMSDRLGEVAIWTGLAFSLRGNETGLMLCILALAFSLLTPYVRSKAESWGAEGRGGWMGRAERMILALAGIGVSGIFDLGLKVLMPILWVFVVLSGLTVAQRIRRTWQQLPS
ncbi:MAG: CDP-alcohol phosphatidyltransferase family protein [Acidimicrobiia bacterium]